MIPLELIEPYMVGVDQLAFENWSYKRVRRQERGKIRPGFQITACFQIKVPNIKSNSDIRTKDPTIFA